ncbi:hypothetical protein KP509_27G059600 [Ceratopteris richardii]|uniref:PORR domain-containing protein n=1 Tax=Ceratopteris richardii TaxID=49495 RepID=A0A8T2RJ96_CERRI|nr:hypothetical protein KP509_27G059600 [Ceratopteris richardii]KAH7295658.1 hypothetical protein KP509_27G059600 [Ceratopteris richardii]
MIGRKARAIATVLFCNGKERVCHAATLQYRSFKNMPGPRTNRRKMLLEKMARRNRVQGFQNLIQSQKALRRVLAIKNALASHPNYAIEAFSLGRKLDEAGLMMQRKAVYLMRKYPCIFKLTESPLWDKPFVEFTAEARTLVDAEKKLMRMNETNLIEKVTRILMMTVDHRLLLDHVCLLDRELGLPSDFCTRVVYEHPEFFKVVEREDGIYLEISEWDDSLAITARELDIQEKPLHNKAGKKLPYGFHISYAKGHRPGLEKQVEMKKWQEMPFISPYENPKGINPMSTQFAKRNVAVIHELLSLTLEKMTYVETLDALRKQLLLPCRLYYFLLKNYGIFYVAEKGKKHAVFLKEAYRATDHPKKVAHLIEKVPQLEFNEELAKLMRSHWDLPSKKIPGLGRGE